MAQYRLSVNVAKRSDGRSATAMAAYRAGEVIQDNRTGERFDYSRKSGILFSRIITPEGAPEWAHDRQELWNRSEKAARRQDAIVVREIQLSLPHELSSYERCELTSNFARFLSDRYRVAVDTCIHAPSNEGDERNYHAHLMVCTRPFDDTKPTGLGNNIRDFDAVARQRQKQQNEVELWRETWVQQVNNALERANVRDEDGVIISVDHRSYKRQGIEQQPTIKEGSAATGARRRGEYSERVEINEGIRARNAELFLAERDIQTTISELSDLELRIEQLGSIAGTHEILNSRQAEHLTADRVSTQLQPANDNLSTERDYYDLLPWEREDGAHQNREAEKIAEGRDKERRQGPDLSR